MLPVFAVETDSKSNRRRVGKTFAAEPAEQIAARNTGRQHMFFVSTAETDAVPDGGWIGKLLPAEHAEIFTGAGYFAGQHMLAPRSAEAISEPDAAAGDFISAIPADVSGSAAAPAGKGVLVVPGTETMSISERGRIGEFVPALLAGKMSRLAADHGMFFIAGMKTKSIPSSIGIGKLFPAEFAVIIRG